MTQKEGASPVTLHEGDEYMKDPWNTTDPRKLSNEELYRLVCFRIPHMAFLDVTDEIRETVIAMIEVSGQKA